MVSNSCGIPTLIDKLVHRLEKEGHALLEGGGNTSSLRNIQRLLWDWEGSVDENADIRFLVFFLKTFLEKFFYNLTGNVPFVVGVTPEIQKRFCNAVGQAFFDLSTHLKEGDYSECYPYYRKLATAYLDAVDALNEAL